MCFHGSMIYSSVTGADILVLFSSNVLLFYSLGRHGSPTARCVRVATKPRPRSVNLTPPLPPHLSAVRTQSWLPAAVANRLVVR